MQSHTFHNEAKAASTGIFLDVGDKKTLLVSIKGTTTSHTLEFKFMNACGDLEVLKGMRPKDWVSGISTSGTGESWAFDIANMKRVYMDITAIVPGAGGSLTVVGEAGY